MPLLAVSACLLLLSCSETDSDSSLRGTFESHQHSSPAASDRAPDHKPDPESAPDPTEEDASALRVKPEASTILGPELPKTPDRPLEDLLRLPESVRREHAEEASGREVLDAPSEEDREAARLRLKVQRQRESAEFHPEGPVTRERTDAGVSIGVGEDARVGGGVHVVKEPDGEVRDPVPTVGVEKRF